MTCGLCSEIGARKMVKVPPGVRVRDVGKGVRGTREAAWAESDLWPVSCELGIEGGHPPVFAYVWE